MLNSNDLKDIREKLEAGYCQPEDTRELLDTLDMWKRYSAFCYSCAMSGEEPYSFTVFCEKHNDDFKV